MSARATSLKTMKNNSYFIFSNTAFCFVFPLCKFSSDKRFDTVIWSVNSNLTSLNWHYVFENLTTDFKTVTESQQSLVVLIQYYCVCLDLISIKQCPNPESLPDEGLIGGRNTGEKVTLI